MTDLISICIPTYNRPDLLREALDSCFEQTYPNFEIVIGDDSKNDQSAALAEEYSARYPGKIHYRRNIPSLGQAGNVNDLFMRANGDRLVLLHDDDLLFPTALEQLAECWNHSPALGAAFGKQFWVDHHGSGQLAESEAMNRTYNRKAETAGLQRVPAIAGLLRMFPNDGYMVLTLLARSIGYRPPSEVGEACDTDFGLRLCLSGNSIWFIDEYMAKYRISDDALSKRNWPEPFAYDTIEKATVPAEALEARRTALQTLASSAVSGFAHLGKPKRALQILLSPQYTFRNRLHPRFAYQLLLIAKASIQNLSGKGKN